MPAHRVSKTQHRARLTTPGTQQSCRQSPQSPMQAVTNSPYQSWDPSLFDPFQSDPFEPSQILGAQAVDAIDETFTQSEPSVPDFTLLDNVVNNEMVVEDLDNDTGNLGQTRPHLAKLELLNLDEWSEHDTYDEEPPSCLHYSIEWKVTLNNKPISKDTEQDLVLAPTFYWSLFLRPKLEKLLQKKLSPNKRVTCDDTNVVVSVTERSERDLTKRFDETKIDWSVVEKQLLAWGELFRVGKKLRVDLSFNYLEVGQPPPTSSRKGGKRGFSSTTQQMLKERATQLDAEEETSRQPSIWREVYDLMRCPGPPCHLGPHCWRDPIGKKHYKLRTHQLKGLITHVERGGQLRTHDDVPEDIRQQLYMEEQQRLERQQKTTNNSSSTFPPINITNVLPAPTHQPSMSTSSMATQPSAAPLAPRLVIPGFRDIAVEEYSDWQQSKVNKETQKAEYQKACDVALTNGLDLEQIHEDQDPSFFINNGVTKGVARRFVSDIEFWVKQYKCVDEMGTSV